MARPRLRNAPVRQVVCELKFPARPKLADATVELLAEALEERYAAYSTDQGVNVQIGPGGVGQQEVVRHRFDDSAGWSVVVANESMWLETTAYVDIDDFVDRWGWVQEAVHSVLRLRSISRIGLRYINQFELGPGPIKQALRDAIDERLIAPWGVLAEDVSVEAVASLQELRVNRDNSGLTMRHGLLPERFYLLDFDHYREGPQGPAIVDRVVKRLREFNDAIAVAFERSVTSSQWDKFGPHRDDDAR